MLHVEQLLELEVEREHRLAVVLRETRGARALLQLVTTGDHIE